MLKKIGLTIALVLGVSAPALAQDVIIGAKCTEPSPTAVPDGATATKDAMLAAVAAFKKFMADSDAYQGCLTDDFTAQKAAADKARGLLNPKIVPTMNAKIDANQKMKTQIGADLNNSIAVYKKAHPAN